MGKFDTLKSLLKQNIAPGLGVGIGLDALINNTNPFSSDYYKADSWSPGRIGNLLLNTAIGAQAGAIASDKTIPLNKRLIESVSLASMAPLKDVYVNALPLMHRTSEAIDIITDNAKKTPKESEKLYDLIKDNSTVLKGLGAGALGLGAIGLVHKMIKNKDKEEKKQQATIKYKIPGKKGDPDTAAVVEVPIDSDKLSPAIVEGIETNIKRQAVKNIKANMKKRDPITGKLISMDEYTAKYGEQALNKTASRAFNEGLGTATSSLLAGSLGALAGRYLYNDNKVKGMLAGGVTGALLPLLLGKAIAFVQEKNRTSTDQAEHDANASIADFVIPGYGIYQNTRRKNLEEKKSDEISGTSYAATGGNPINEAFGISTEDAVDADYDTLSKYSSALPQQPRTQQNPVSINTEAPVQKQSVTADSLDKRRPTALTQLANNIMMQINSLKK